MKGFGIIGSCRGKARLAQALVRHLTLQGLRVSTIKRVTASALRLRSQPPLSLGRPLRKTNMLTVPRTIPASSLSGPSEWPAVEDVARLDGFGRDQDIGEGKVTSLRSGWPECSNALRERQPWDLPGIEPPLCDILAEPLTRAIMRSDRVTPSALKSVIVDAQLRLRSRP